MVEREADRYGPRFDLAASPVQLRYLILSQARTGSSMLCSALRETGAAGSPMEYLSEKPLERLPQPVTRDMLADYLVDLESRRTTVNGVFGIKLHYGQFQKLYMAEGKISKQGVGFLRSFSHFILVRRQDKIAQAMSLFIATRSNMWNSTDATEQGRHNYDFRSADVPELIRHLHKMTVQDQAWLEICGALGLRMMEVVYETLASSPQSEVERVLAFLGIDAAYRPPRTVKLSRDSNGEAKRRFLEELGVFVQPAGVIPASASHD